MAGPEHNLCFRSPLGIYSDPGNAGRIQPAYSAVIPITTTTTETRTLADPVMIGQMIAIVFAVDAGDCVITADHGLNQTGNTVITLADAGEYLVLIGLPVGDALRWRALAPMPESELTALS